MMDTPKDLSSLNKMPFYPLRQVGADTLHFAN